MPSRVLTFPRPRKTLGCEKSIPSRDGSASIVWHCAALCYHAADAVQTHYSQFATTTRLLQMASAAECPAAPNQVLAASSHQRSLSRTAVAKPVHGVRELGNSYAAGYTATDNTSTAHAYTTELHAGRAGVTHLAVAFGVDD